MSPPSAANPYLASASAGPAAMPLWVLDVQDAGSVTDTEAHLGRTPLAAKSPTHATTAFMAVYRGFIPGRTSGPYTSVPTFATNRRLSTRIVSASLRESSFRPSCSRCICTIPSIAMPESCITFLCMGIVLENNRVCTA